MTSFTVRIGVAVSLLGALCWAFPETTQAAVEAATDTAVSSNGSVGSLSANSATPAAQAPTTPAPTNPVRPLPEKIAAQPPAAAAGISVARLKRLDAYLDDLVQDGALQGAVLTMSRRGQNVLTRAVGWQDADQRTAMPVDAVFDLSLLTEPVTAAAALILQEQGKWLLSDPLGRYLPAFKPLPVTAWDALTHTGGLADSLRPPRFSAGKFASYARRLHHSLDAAHNFTGERFTESLAAQPLARTPGLVAERTFSYDLLGLAMEKAGGQTLGAFFLRNLFIPLDMWDTGFNPSASLETRLVLTAPDEPGELDRPPVRDLRNPVSFECGGACLTGTAVDYLRFATMLLNEGQADGQRLLSRASATQMTRTQLAPTVENRLPFFAADAAAAARGLGVNIHTGRPLAGLPLAAGDFGLASPNGSFFWVSPSEQLVVVMLAAAAEPEFTTRMQRQVIALVYQSIDD